MQQRLAEAGELTEKLEGLPAIDPIVDFEATIDALGERLGKYLGDEDDVPKLARRIAELNDQIHALMRDLGVNDDPSNIESVLPSKITFAKIRELIKNGAVIRAALNNSRTVHEEAKTALVDAEADLEHLPPDVDVSEPSELLAQAAKLGDVTNTLAGAKLEADAGNAGVLEALGRLGLWSGTVDELAALPIPDATAVSRSEDSRVLAKQEIDAIDKALKEAKRDAHQVEADLAGLETAGEIPSPKAIRDARDEREGHWRQIRSRLFRPAEVASESAIESPDPDLVGTYETNVRHADELVDRREAEAHRVAQLAVLTGKQKRLANRIAELEGQRDAANENMRELDSNWQRLWDGTNVAVQSPQEMEKWLTRRDEVLRLRGEARKTDGKLGEIQKSASTARTLLEKAARLLRLEEPAQDFVDLDRQMRQALSRVQAAATEKSAAMTRVKAARKEFQNTKSALERAESADVKWLAAWQLALDDIHLVPSAGTAQAETALSAWEAVTAPLTKRKEDERRHKGLNEDLERFRADVHIIAAELSEETHAGVPIEKIVRDLKTRLDNAKAAFQDRANLQGRVAGLKLAREKSEEQHRAATFVIEGLRRTNGLKPEVDAYDLARRSIVRRGLDSQILERATELPKAGDGLGEQTLQAEVDSVPPDQANAELAAVQEQEAILIARIQSLASAETQAEHELAALGGKRGAAIADQEARNATLAAGGHIERWLRLEVARLLLERSVRRYQDENQNPMITRASELFARIARTAANPIERISIDYRDASKPILTGRRHDGSECRREGLSEATSDQLFLSLRVAAIERYCHDAEPIPFIADDLFVSSDEQRVRPLLQILAELGQTTQVIAFTHHKHVVDIARTIPETGIQIHEMPATT